MLLVKNAELEKCRNFTNIMIYCCVNSGANINDQSKKNTKFSTFSF